MSDTDPITRFANAGAQSFTAMSLRDFFAAKALPGYVHLMPMIWTDASVRENAQHIATRCYQIADAMLAEREKRAEPSTHGT